MRPYLDLLQKTMDEGVDKGDRTGVGTRSIIGPQVRYNLQDGFPLLTTKKVYVRAIIHELLWFLSGNTNIQYLKDNNVTIWDEWATEEGELGPVYGSQWRNWKGSDGKVYDQIQALMDGLVEKPNSRRHLFHGWNVADLPDESLAPHKNAAQGKMALPPCHLLYQFFVNNGRLDALLYIRSNDLFLGHPFNTASLAFLTHMIAQQVGLTPGEIIITMGDAHIYHNHFDQVREQLSREPREKPTLEIVRKPESIFDYKFEDFVIHGYNPHPPIKAPIAV